jgi:hypothetical protein
MCRPPVSATIRSERVWCVDESIGKIRSFSIPNCRQKQTVQVLSIYNTVSYQGREMTWIRHTLSGTLSPTSAKGAFLLCLSNWVGPRLTSADLTASMLAPLTSSMLTPHFILAYLHGDSLNATLYPSVKGVILRP